MPEFNRNNFLVDLLSLQQDGSGAISAPSNWSEPPLLSVKTELDSAVDKVAEQLVSNNSEGNTGAWWFLVGSPGTGKSAAVGRLVRSLRDKHDATFRLEKSPNGELGVEISELAQGELPYKVELYEKGNSFSSAWFAQDASVVRNPFSEDADPADELIDLVRDANEKGVSLVVCANRGVLEKARDIASRDTKNKRSSWFRALDAVSRGENVDLLELETTASKPVFQAVGVTATSLDTKSLLQSRTLSKVLAQATRDDRWEQCNSCAASSLCPFRQNRQWLMNDEHVGRLETVIRCAELYSGQVVVFREAVALISLLLAGSAKDYRGTSPCDFVRAQIEAKAYFTLLSRRIYMLLFSASSPFGLERHPTDYDEQLNALSELAQPPSVPAPAVAAISNLAKAEHRCSTDIGLSRLLSSTGVISYLDPIKENQGKDLESRWDAGPKVIESIDQPLISEIEKKCLGIWHNLESALDSYGDKTISTYRWLRRWVSSVTYRLGFFAEGNILFEEELIMLDKTIGEPSSGTSAEHLRHLSRISRQLETMLAISREGVEISPFVRLDGHWAATGLTVQISNEESGFGGVSAKIGSEPIDLSGQVFAWLDRKARTGLLRETFPPEILQIAEDLRRRAASGSGYAFAENDVRLLVKLPNSDQFLSIERYGQHAVVEHTE